jgi:hypothetical protein
MYRFQDKPRPGNHFPRFSSHVSLLALATSSTFSTSEKGMVDMTWLYAGPSQWQLRLLAHFRPSAVVSTFCLQSDSTSVTTCCWIPPCTVSTFRGFPYLINLWKLPSINRYGPGSLSPCMDVPTRVLTTPLAGLGRGTHCNMTTLQSI